MDAIKEKDNSTSLTRKIWLYDTSQATAILTGVQLVDETSIPVIDVCSDTLPAADNQNCM